MTTESILPEGVRFNMYDSTEFNKQLALKFKKTVMWSISAYIIFILQVLYLILKYQKIETFFWGLLCIGALLNFCFLCGSVFKLCNVKFKNKLITEPLVKENNNLLLNAMSGSTFFIVGFIFNFIGKETLQSIPLIYAFIAVLVLIIFEPIINQNK